MAASNDPLYPQLPIHLDAVVTAANTDIDDAPDAAIAELALPADIETDGGQLVALWAIPRATCSATALYLYTSRDAGTTKRLALAELAPADTVSTTDAPTLIHFNHNGARISLSNPFQVPPGAGGSKFRLYVGASVALAAGWVFHAQVLRNTKAAVA